MHTSRFLLVPTRQRGNAVGTRQRLFLATLARCSRHSHAGAWKRGKSICYQLVCI